MATVPSTRSSEEAFLGELVEHGLLIETGVAGVYGRGGVFEDALERFTALVTKLAAESGPELMRFPPVLARRDLERSGYLRSFPHLAATVFAFSGSEAQAAEQYESARRHEDWSACQAMTDLVLTPAACYPVYPAIATRGPLAPGGVTIDTGPAYVFRREPSRDPARLQTFRMHELIRIGEPDAVSSWLALWRERAAGLLRDIGLDVEFNVANDPFFGRAGQLLAESQRAQKMKFELSAPIAGDERTAVVSFNYHETHFSSVYGLELADGELAHTACLGFGLERTSLALIRAHGFEPERWPVAVRSLLWPR